MSTSSRGEGVSFAAEAAGGEAPSWRMRLPADPQAARDRLEAAREQCRAFQAALEAVPGRVAGVVAGGREGAQSFAVGAADTPEAELILWINQVEPTPGEVSFDLAYGLGEDVQAGLRRLQASLAELTRLITHFAWVETYLGEQVLGRTVVGWSGDLLTLWGRGRTPDELELHERSLALALEGRLLLLRTFTLATQTAAKLSVLMTTPAGALLALPAAWKFIQQILVESEKYRGMKGSQPPPPRPAGQP